VENFFVLEHFPPPLFGARGYPLDDFQVPSVASMGSLEHRLLHAASRPIEARGSLTPSIEASGSPPLERADSLSWNVPSVFSANQPYAEVNISMNENNLQMCLCVYYCSTYYKTVCVGGEG
jgi:hypothetical protein